MLGEKTYMEKKDELRCRGELLRLEVGLPD